MKYFNKPKDKRAIVIEFNCEQCSLVFWESPSNSKSKKHHFCSQKCSGLSRRGKPSGIFKKGLAGYVSLHDWVRRHKIRPPACEHCGSQNRFFQWANVSGEYKWELTDWQNLCVPCHKKFDKNKIRTISAKELVNNRAMYAR